MRCALATLLALALSVNLLADDKPTADASADLVFDLETSDWASNCVCCVLDASTSTLWSVCSVVGLAAVANLPTAASTSLFATLTATAPARLSPSLVISLVTSLPFWSFTVCLPLDAAAWQDALQARQRVAVKIAGEFLPAVPASYPGTAFQRASLDALASAGQWQRLARPQARADLRQPDLGPRLALHVEGEAFHPARRKVPTDDQGRLRHVAQGWRHAISYHCGKRRL